MVHSGYVSKYNKGEMLHIKSLFKFTLGINCYALEILNYALEIFIYSFTLFSPVIMELNLNSPINEGAPPKENKKA